MNRFSIISIANLNDFFAPGMSLFFGEKKISDQINSHVFSEVPVEIVHKIFSYLTLSELVGVRMVSHHFTILEGDLALFTFLAGIFI